MHSLVTLASIRALACCVQVPMPWRARSFRCVVMWGASLIHDALAESHWPFTPVTVLRSSWSSYRTETSCLRDLVVFLLPPWLVQWCLAVLVIGEARLSSACALVPEPAEPRIYGQEPDAVTDGKRALNLPLVDFTMLDVVFVLYVFEEVTMHSMVPQSVCEAFDVLDTCRGLANKELFPTLCMVWPRSA